MSLMIEGGTCTVLVYSLLATLKKTGPKERCALGGRKLKNDSCPFCGSAILPNRKTIFLSYSRT